MNTPAETDTPSARRMKWATVVSVLPAFVAAGTAGLHAALDVAFNTAYLPLMLRLDDMAPRYRPHFFNA